MRQPQRKQKRHGGWVKQDYSHEIFKWAEHVNIHGGLKKNGE